MGSTEYSRIASGRTEYNTLDIINQRRDAIDSFSFFYPVGGGGGGGGGQEPRIHNSERREQHSPP